MSAPVLATKDDVQRSILPVMLPPLVQAVLDIALAHPDRRVGPELARSCGYQPRALEGYFQCLMHDGILYGKRGPGGGHRLGREPSRISVGDICRSAQRYAHLQFDAKTWPERDNWPVSGTIGCSVVRPALEVLDRKLMGELDNMTIADLMRPIVEQGGGI